MAISRNSIQVTWSGANTISVAAAGTNDSDSISLSSTGIAAQIMCKADNSGTPADGDTVDVYLQYIADPDGDSANDTDTIGISLCQLDTYNDGGLAVKTVQLPIGFTSVRLHVENNGASAMTFSATINEVLSA